LGAWNVAGVNLRARTNEAEVVSGFEAFVAAITNVAAPRALNKLNDQGQTAAFRKAADVYRIPVRKLAQYASVKPARPGDLRVELTVKGNGFPLIDLGARQTKRGVSVPIKGRRQVFPGTFIARMPNGHVGVFARGAYGGKGVIRASGGAIGRFVLGRDRLPINQLYTFSPAEMARNEATRNAYDARVAEQSSKVLAQEVRFATGGGSK
jgi:hypothetical protein